MQVIKIYLFEHSNMFRWKKKTVSEFHYKFHKYLLLKLNNTYGSEFALAQFKTENMKELILLEKQSFKFKALRDKVC